MKGGFSILLLMGLCLVVMASGAWAEEEKEGARLGYSLEYLFSYTTTLTRELIGPCPEGIWVNAIVTGGEVSGPKIMGKIRPVGGHWNTIRSDGVGIIDARLTIETQEGALILLTYPIGVLEYGEDAHQKLIQGRKDVPRFVPCRAALVCHTAHPNYRWLNRLLCLGIGEFDRERLEGRFDVYAVR